MKLYVFTMSVWLIAASAQATPLAVIDDCDIGAPNLKDFAAATAEECGAACEQDAACAAFTHISGWNRCFLKKKATPKTTVKMYSGYIKEEEGKRSIAEEGYALDHNGKDWKKHETNNPNECREACLKAPECKAFTLIEGYKACWLKKTAGKLRGKVFKCGVKS